MGIQLCVFSPDEIEKRSVVEITNAGTYEGNEPKIGGLFDPRMGVIDNGKECRSCGQTNHKCPGHFGHFRLARPVYYIQFLPFILNILSCVCIRCSKLRIDKNYRSHFLKKKGEVRWREVLAASKEIHRCGQETEDGCGALQPTRFVREGIARIMAEWDDDASGSKSGKQTQILEVEYVLRLFRKILDEDVDFIGLNRYWCRPDWMICTVLPIPPPQVRPSVIQDNNQRSEDDLTHKLAEIVKTNNSYLQPKIDANAAKSVIDEWTNVLQYHIATLVDNQIPGVAPSAQRNGRPLKSIQQRLGSKEGRIRYNIQGKRVEFSARSVITPDPNISIAELGVPEKIAMNLTRPERVTLFNRNKLYRLIQNGPLKYPGAKTIRRVDGRIISLRHVNTKEIVLNLGDIVNRHLMDNDPILFNRQPTLHRMSMMAHKVKVLTGKTFRLNVSVTAPYNADFDGDEMNAHAPQSIEAATELEEIAAVPHQILRPRDGLPVIGIVQDTLVGSYRLTRDSVQFNTREFMNMMMWNKRFTGVLPPPKKETHWSGQQIISQLLPPINIDMMNGGKKRVLIREGEVVEGQFDKGIFSKASKGIIHMTYNDYGSKDTVQFIDSLQNTVAQFLIYDGFSVGISDLIADANTKKEMNETIQSKKKQIETVLLEVHQDLFDNNTGKTNQSEFEDRAFGLLNKAMETAGEIGQNTLSTENRMTAMVRAGSKGGPINIAQMIACVGQQNIEGKRIPYGFEDRTLPHFKKYDDGAEARGFIENSFIGGLTPTEFFFHAMSGREGLIDTAVKSVTGDTKIVIFEDGVTKCVAIGDWIDGHMNSVAGGYVEHFPEENDLEMLQLGSDSIYIPSVSADGKVSWRRIAAVTRHDPGQQLYEVTTLGGRSVIVPESKSLLIWRPETKTFEQMPTPDVRPGHCMPVTMNLATPPSLCESISLKNYLSKRDYLYGTDFQLAEQAVEAAMMDRHKIPAGWWTAKNGTTFTLPYESKALYVRTLSRSKTDNILPGFVYPFTTNRDHARIPEEFALTAENGRFLGLFLAEGNVDVKSGYVAITNNNATIRQFVHDWFEAQRIRTSEDVRLNAIGGVSTTVRGYSTVLAKFLDVLVGHGAASKYVPAEAFAAPKPFITALLDGYFSGDGTISSSSIEAGSASKDLIEGISMLCSRLGIFAKVFSSQLQSNNLGTETILPTYRISIRAQWATLFADQVTLIDELKQEKLVALKASAAHRNFPFQNDVVLDEIVDICPVSTNAYPKLYDLTVPETFTFGLANGLQVYDTADTGYIQRQIVKAMEDLVVQNDGTVRDANMNITQFQYGEDGINSTKIESQPLPLASMTDDELDKEFGLKDVDLSEVLGVPRGDDAEVLAAYTKQIYADRKMIVEEMFRSGRQGNIYSPVNLERLILNIKIKFGLRSEQKTNLTPATVLKGIEGVLKKTQGYHIIWAALLRFYLSPSKLILQDRFTESAFDTLCEVLVTKNWQAWVQPGEHVGIIAAQSIGEPSTQMSCLRHAFVQISKNGGNHVGAIGDFIDKMLASNAEDVITIGEDSVVYDLPEGKECYIMGVSNDEKTSWKRISQVSRHPANGGLVKVTTKSGRSTTATLTHSFLKRTEKGIEPVLGSELAVGMRMPIATKVDQVPLSLITSHSGFTLDRDFGWLCGIYLADGCFIGNTVSICKIHPMVEQCIRSLAERYSWSVTVRNYQGEYGPSKNTNISSKALKDFLLAEFDTGSYEKTVGAVTYSAPREFQEGLLSGYFDGDGNVNAARQQIRAGSRSKGLIRHINRLLSYCGFFSVMGEETSVRIPDKIFYTINVLKRYAAEFKERIGFRLQEKATALDEIIAYMEREDKHDTKELFDKIPEVGHQIAAVGKALELPGQSRLYGRWTKKESVGRQTLQAYVKTFEAATTVDTSEEILSTIAALRSAAYSDVIWDEIVNLEYLADPKEYVYDFTVPGNDSFMVDDAILVHNTLNSVDWDTKVMIAKNGEIVCPQIGEFIDAHLAAHTDKIQEFPNNQLYLALDDGNDWQAISCDEEGKMMWTKLEAITRHPVVNEDGTNTILEVTLASGRTIKATKGKSFLTLIDGKVQHINGSELNVGDILPIANSLALDGLRYKESISLRTILPATEWMYGTDVHAALHAMQGDRHWFQKNQGTLFTVPYSRSDAFREAIVDGKNTNAETIRPGFVYPARTRPDVSQIPEQIPLTQEFGFFVGAYLAEGMANTTQINITNNDSAYLERVNALMAKWNVGTHMVCEQKEAEKTGIKGTTSSLVIHSTLLATVMQIFGRVSHEKTLPEWVFQAPDDFVKGLVDGYISGDGTVEKKTGCVKATSVSKVLISRLGTLLARFGIFSTLSSRTPDVGVFDSVRTNYTLYVPVKYSKIFAETFTLSHAAKQNALVYHFTDDYVPKCRRKTIGDMIWDTITSIKEIAPLKDRVYDFTVEKTRNFMTEDCIACADTFHLAGVASKSNVTRGVPRLKELLKVTQNPKAVSLTIPLKPEFRNSKEKAREVAQDLELTLLRDMTVKTAIYYDPSDTNTVLKEDEDLLAFYKLFEVSAEGEEALWSKWILRLELNREKMFDKNVTMEDILFVLRRLFDTNIRMVYSDFNSQKLVMRIRLTLKSMDDGKSDPSSLDALSAYKKFQNKLLNSVIIRGFPGIKAVTFRKGDERFVYDEKEKKYMAKEEYILDTDGSNFLEAMNHPAVDGTRVYSTHVHDVLGHLGIEATRQILYNEIQTLFEDGQINYRHLGLLVDVMTRAGRLMSVDRYGINKLDIGPLAKASFEETERILLKAAVFGEIDPITGVSANIMTGQPMRGGTTFTEVLLDEGAFMSLQKNMPEPAVIEPDEDQRMGLGAVDVRDVDDMCSPSRLKMNMTLPSSGKVLDEDDIDFAEIEEDDSI